MIWRRRCTNDKIMKLLHVWKKMHIWKRNPDAYKLHVLIRKNLEQFFFDVVYTSDNHYFSDKLQKDLFDNVLLPLSPPSVSFFFVVPTPPLYRHRFFFLNRKSQLTIYVQIYFSHRVFVIPEFFRRFFFGRCGSDWPSYYQNLQHKCQYLNCRNAYSPSNSRPFIFLLQNTLYNINVTWKQVQHPSQISMHSTSSRESQECLDKAGNLLWKCSKTLKPETYTVNLQSVYLLSGI